MNKEIVINKENKEIYLNQVIYKCEEIRNLILKTFINDFIFVSKIDLNLIPFKANKIYFSFDSYRGVCKFDDEFSARKKLLDIMKFFKKCFFDCFDVETIEVEVVGERGSYELLFSDDLNQSHLLLTLSLSNDLLDFSLIDLEKNIYIIISNAYDGFLSWDRSKNPLVILTIQKNKIASEIKRIKEQLINEEFLVIDEVTNLSKMEEKLINEGHLLLIEVGPSNVKKQQLTLVTDELKRQIPINDLLLEINKVKDASRKHYYQLSLKKVLNFNKKVVNFDDLINGNRFCCCLEKTCLSKIQDKIKFKKLYYPFTNLRFSKKCIVCQKEGKNIIFGDN